MKKAGVVKVYRFPVINEVGESIWKERRPISFLEDRRKEMGEDIYAKEILLKPVSSKTSVFKDVNVSKAMKTSQFLGQTPYRDGEIVVMGVDFAFSDAKGADYTVITVVGRLDNRYRIIDVWRKRGTSIREILDALIDLLHKYPQTRVVVAENTGQQIAVVKELKERLPIYVYPFDTKEYTRNKIISILALLFENNRISVPSKNFYISTRDYSLELKSELAGFINLEGKYSSRAKHDDCVFSLAFATWYLYEKFNIFGDGNSLNNGVYIDSVGSTADDMFLDARLNRNTLSEEDEEKDDYDNSFNTGGFGW